MSKINIVKGNYYEHGFKMGEIFKKALQTETLPFVDAVKKETTIDILNFQTERLKKDYPFIYEELKGRADGAEISYKLYLYYICYEIDERSYYSDKCTTILVNDADNLLLAHNEDGNYNPDNINIAEYHFEDGRVLKEIANADNLLSATILKTSNGFSYSTNYIWYNDYNLQYMPRNLFYRVLANAKSFDDAINIIKTVPICAGCSINIVDEKNKKLYSVEKFQTEYSIVEVKGIFAHSNHFIHDKFKHLQMPLKELGESTTLTRKWYSDMLIEELKNDNKSFNEDNILSVLQYYNINDFNSVLLKKSEGNEILTYGTYILDLKNNSSKIYKYMDNKEVFDF